MENQDGMIISVDFSKAFDMVHWEFLFRALEWYGFGPNFVDLIRMLFNDIEPCVTNGGTSSGFFKPQWGIRQGYCVSPYLFLLVVEVMAVMIRRSQDIQGIQLSNSEIRIVQFADDSTCLLKDESSLKHLVAILNRFRGWSGLRLNKSKSMILLPGRRGPLPPQLELIPVVRKVKILGIWMFHEDTVQNNIKWNFDPLLNKIKSVCSSWNHRTLSLKGKVTVANSLLMSILQYPCASIFTPPQVFKDYRNIITQFIWNGRKAKVAFKTLVLPISRGGLNLMDLETRVQSNLLQWPKRFVLAPTSNAALTLGHLLRTDSIVDSFSFTISKVPEGVTHIMFYIQMFKYWIQFHSTSPTTETQIRRQVIWNNRWITSNGQPLFWKDWKRKGINTMDNICNGEEGRLYSHTEIMERYHVRCSVLDSLKIRLSIPIHWRSAITPNWQQPVNPPNITGVFISLPGEEPRDISTSSSRAVYSALILQNSKSPTALARWSEMPEDQLRVDNTIEWNNICLNPYRTMRETKMQSLHYKIINRILPCNVFLRQLRIKETDVCSFCDQLDSIDHFLFSCKIVQDLWSKICDWFDRTVDLGLRGISIRDIIFGITDNSSKSRVANYIVMQTKHFVHRQKLFHQGDLRLLHFLQELKMKLKHEKFIHRQEGRNDKFKKWEGILLALG